MLLSRAAGEGPDLIRDLSFLHEEIAETVAVPDVLVQRLLGLGLRQRMRELTDRIRRAEEKGEDSTDLLKEKQGLAEELHQLDATGPSSKPNFP